MDLTFGSTSTADVLQVVNKADIDEQKVSPNDLDTQNVGG